MDSHGDDDGGRLIALMLLAAAVLAGYVAGLLVGAIVARR